MTTTPTPEQFLALTEPDDEDLPEPLESIADSLRRLVAGVERHEEAENHEGHLQQLLDQLDVEYAELQAKLDQVLEICKPSTSKLANAIREVLEPPTATPVEEPSTAPDEAASDDQEKAPAPPSDDAPVEEWRAFARTRHGITEGTFIDSMNRSQIRTMLGLPQPTSSEGADQ